MKRSPKANPSADSYVLSLCAGNPNLLIPHWLIASFMYYIEDAPLLADSTFDSIVHDLGEHWGSLGHRHKHLIDPSLFKSGFYVMPEDYPEIIKGSASELRRMYAHGVPSPRKRKPVGAPKLGRVDHRDGPQR